MKRQPKNSPGTKRKTEKAVGQGFLAPAFLPKNGGDGEQRGWNDGRNREQVCGVGRSPNSQYDGGHQGMPFPALPLRVDLRTEEEQQRRKPKQPVGQRAFEDTGHGGLRNGGRDVMNSKNEPGRSPEKKIVLAFDAVDIRKEARHKKRGDQQRQRGKAL